MNVDGVNYTTKELLDRIDKKIDLIDIKLDMKAERDRVHEIGNAITAMEGRILAQTTNLDTRLSLLEAGVVRHDSPVISEVRNYEKKVDALATKMDERKDAASQNFSRRQKAVGFLFIGINTVLAFLALGPVRFHP